MPNKRPVLSIATLFVLASCGSGGDAGAEAAGGEAAMQEPGLLCVPGAGTATEPTVNLVVDPRTIEYAPELGVDFANMVATPEGIFCSDQTVGDGDPAYPRGSVTVHYTGALANGEVFDSSRGRDVPFTFNLGTGSVIPGWDIGIMGMREGGRRTLVIPSELAYGPMGSGGDGTIPPNAVLVFDVELLEVD